MSVLEDLKLHLQEVFDDVSSLIENRHVFYKLRELLKPNMAITDNVFFNHYVVNYANATTSSVRRQIDIHTTRGGLRIVLEKILSNPELISKQYYLGNIPPGGAVFMAEKIWNTQYGGGEFLDPEIVKTDIVMLEQATAKLKKFVDKRVAHKDKDAKLYDIQWGELDSAIDILEKLTMKYYCLVVSPGSAMSQGLLAGDIDGWERIFYEPWVK